MKMQYSKATTITFIFEGIRILSSTEKGIVKQCCIVLPVDKQQNFALGNWEVSAFNNYLRIRKKRNSPDAQLWLKTEKNSTETTTVEYLWRGNVHREAIDHSEIKILSGAGERGWIIYDEPQEPVAPYTSHESNGLIHENDTFIKATNQENNILIRENERLNKLLNLKVEEFIKIINEEAEGIQNEIEVEAQYLNEKLQEKNAIEIELQRMNNMILKVQEEMESLRIQQKELKEKEEYISGDCAKMREKLEEEKARFEMDSRTIELMEKGPRLKEGTISASLQTIGDQITTVEAKIKHVLEFQEKYQKKVNDAIEDGGYLTTEEE